MSSYDTGYPTEKISKDNPYYCCAYCGISEPQINGKIENHASDCEYRLKKEKEKDIEVLKEEIVFLKFLIKEVITSLPVNRDWLDPDIEKAMKEI